METLVMNVHKTWTTKNQMWTNTSSTKTTKNHVAAHLSLCNSLSIWTCVIYCGYASPHNVVDEREVATLSDEHKAHNYNYALACQHPSTNLETKMPPPIHKNV